MLRKMTRYAVASFLAGGFFLQVQAQSLIVVSPSGGDDTAALQAAFDTAVAAGPGSTVQLEAGIYCVMNPIIVRGFDGHWQGVSRKQTTVKTCTETFPVPADIVADPAYPADPLLQIISPFVFIEVEGKPPTNLSISDMTIHLEGETNPWLAHGLPEPLTIFRPAVLIAGKRPTIVDGIVSSASLHVDSIELRANAEGLVFNLPSDTNIDSGFAIQGGVVGNIFQATDFEPIKATVSVTRSHFEKVAFSVLLTEFCTGCDITVGGSADHGNSFNLLYGAPLFGASIGETSTVDVSHNRGTTQFGAIRWVAFPTFFLSTPLQPPEVPSHINISHNRLDLFAHWINRSFGMWLDDFSLYFGLKAMQTSITHNTIRQVDIGFGTDALAGILHITGKDTVIWNNNISGNFILGGIVAGFAGPGIIGENLSIIGNNLSNTESDVAPIWLGPFSSSSVVVGGPNKGHVLDEGTDNIVTGAGSLHGGPPGPAIQAAIQQILESRGSNAGL